VFLIRLFFLILFLFSIQGACYAQDYKHKYKKRTAEEKARYFTKQMIDSLSLTADQENRCYEINLEVTKRFNTLYADTSLSKTDRKPYYRSIYQYRDSSLRKALDRKQFLRFLDIEMERRNRKQETKR